MNVHAIYHRPESNFCFAISKNSVVLRIRFAKDEDINNLSVLYNSKYDIAKKQYKASMSFLCCDGTYDYYRAILTLKDPRLAYVFEFFSKGKKYYFVHYISYFLLNKNPINYYIKYFGRKI